MSSNEGRVVSIVPTSRGGFGFSVIEYEKRLLDWGTIAKTEPVRMKKRLEKLLTRYSPTWIIVPSNPKKAGRGWTCIIESVGITAGERGVSMHVCQPKASIHAKHARAVQLTERFPELKPWLPRKRKPWNSESETMAIFDSLWVAVAEN